MALQGRMCQGGGVGGVGGLTLGGGGGVDGLDSVGLEVASLQE